MTKLNNELIEEIKKNLFFRSRNAIDNYKNFPWHTYNGKITAHQPNSSQAIAIDVFGCLKQSLEKNKIINSFFGLNTIKNWEINFEFQDPDLLNEIKPTQVDVLLDNDEYALIIECKFSEKNYGHCSQVDKNKLGLSRCNGNYLAKCSLSEKGIKYWDFIEKTLDYKKDEIYQPCPFKGATYQWMRLICFTRAYEDKFRNKAFFALFYFDDYHFKTAKNIKDGKPLNGLEVKIRDNNIFKYFSYQDFIKKQLKFVTQEKRKKFGKTYLIG